MSASPTKSLDDEIYDCLVNIVSPDWSKWPPSFALLEISILPSSSHPEIQYDPESNPPAVGIPRSLGLACFLRARSILLAHVKAVSGNLVENGSSKTAFLYEKTQVLGATAVILVWEPNHLTAINWRRRILHQLLQGFPTPEHLEFGQKAWCAEYGFLESLLTSPMSQHAKSSMLWAYRLHLLRASEELCGTFAQSDSPWRGLTAEEFWRKELKIVMLAGERHSKNYYAWEYARQVSRLLFDGKLRKEGENVKGGSSCILQESQATIHQWCLMHPKDISGWAFLASWLQRAFGNATDLQETSEVLTKTREIVKTFDWNGESVNWFLRAMED